MHVSDRNEEGLSKQRCQTDNVFQHCSGSFNTAEAMSAVFFLSLFFKSLCANGQIPLV